MIHAVNSDALRYLGIDPGLDLALRNLNDEFLSKLEEGVPVELDGKNVYCTRFTYNTIPESESFFEAHRRYLDIHVMLQGEERVDVAAPESLTLDEAKEENDFYAYSGTPHFTTVIRPGDFLVVFPADAHRIKVQIGSSKTVTKAVFKVLLQNP